MDCSGIEILCVRNPRYLQRKPPYSQRQPPDSLRKLHRYRLRGRAADRALACAFLTPTWRRRCCGRWRARRRRWRLRVRKRRSPSAGRLSPAATFGGGCKFIRCALSRESMLQHNFFVSEGDSAFVGCGEAVTAGELRSAGMGCVANVLETLVHLVLPVGNAAAQKQCHYSFAGLHLTVSVVS